MFCFVLMRCQKCEEYVKKENIGKLHCKAPEEANDLDGKADIKLIIQRKRDHNAIWKALNHLVPFLKDDCSLLK